jgi:hypothetical protein
MHTPIRHATVFSFLFITAFLGAALVLLPSARAQGVTVIAETSFEEPAAAGGQYTDTGDPLVDHDLVNNPGEPLVDFTSTGSEIGFDSRYVNTRDSDGLTDGDFVGVTDFTGTVGSFTDGSQGFQISDPDGKMVTEFDPVDLTGTTAPYVALDVFIQDTGYEDTDQLRIFATDGTQEIDLINLTGAELEGRGTWEFIQADLAPLVGTSVTLVFELDANSGSEAVYIDNVQFSSDGPLPVELAAFTAARSEDGALLEWTTTSETGNAGFDVQHQQPGAERWESLGFVDGAGTTRESRAYRFRVGPLSAPGIHRFRLRQVDVDGTESLSGVRSIEVQPASVLTVIGPNPIRSGRPVEALVRPNRTQAVQLALYNVLGQKVQVGLDETVGASPRRVSIPTTGLASGIYFLRLQGDQGVQTRKLTIVR